MATVTGLWFHNLNVYEDERNDLEGNLVLEHNGQSRQIVSIYFENKLL
jgi:hypothetical protein